jgi:hypothetical protein
MKYVGVVTSFNKKAGHPFHPDFEVTGKRDNIKISNIYDETGKFESKSEWFPTKSVSSYILNKLNCGDIVEFEISMLNEKQGVFILRTDTNLTMIYSVHLT